MPTNLPPEYFEAEERYKAAATPEDRIRLLEELISTVPKHKGTDKLRADLRRRLSKMKSDAQSKKSVSRHVSAYHIDREGAGQVVVLGPPNVGKSALVDALTNATPEVAEHPFTTWTPTPGMMDYEGVQIQLIDTPPLNPEYVEPDMMNLIRRADLMLLVIDLQTYPVEQLEDALAFLAEQRIAPPELRGSNPVQQRLIYIPMLVVVNKNDSPATDELFDLFTELLDDEWSMVSVSARTGRNLDELKRAIFERLNLIRVYSRPPGEEPDLSRPFVLDVGSTVEAFAGRVHKDFLEHLKSARVWGSGAFEGQLVARDHVLQDGDIVELRA